MKVAKLYARALFELAVEKRILQEIQQDFSTLVETFNSQAELGFALSAFTFSLEERLSVVKKLAQKTNLNPLLSYFLEVLISKGRLPLIQNIYDSFQALVDESQNIMRGTVITVEPLNEADRTDLAKAFSKKFNKQITLEQVVDKDILGGLIVQVKGNTFDGSLRTTIRNLKENLERHS